MKTKTNVKAAGFIVVRNHNRNQLKVRTGLKSAGVDPFNHNRTLLK